MNDAQGYSIDLENSALVISSHFTVDTQAVRLKSSNLTGGNYVEIQHAVGPVTDNNWEAVVRNGEPLQLTQNNNEILMLISGTYRCVYHGSDVSTAKVYYETTGILLDTNVRYVYQDQASLSVGPVSSVVGASGAVSLSALEAGGVAPIDSPTFTGIPTVPTASIGTNTIQAASTAFVHSYAAPIASPTFTGVPSGPTAAPGTNTTQLASTAFVQAYAPGTGTNGYVTFWTGASTQSGDTNFTWDNTLKTLSVRHVLLNGHVNFNNTLNSGTVNILSTDGVYFLNAATNVGTATFNLPTVASVGPGRPYVFKDIAGNAATNNITIVPSGSETIDGAASYVINTNNGSVTIASLGATRWGIVAKI